MVYRTPELPESEGGLVTVRRYLDPLDAQMAKAHLAGGGIRAHVLEGVSFNPLLSGVGGGVQLQVGERDVEQAEAILDAAAPGAITSAPDDGEDPGVVRCPRCELAYCAFERDRPRAGGWHPLALLISLPTMLFGSRRWRCARCEHVWDDAKAGPAVMTRLEPGEPRPVFRLRRAHPGMGLMIGVVLGFLASVVLHSEVGLLLALAIAVVGWLVGWSMRYDVCSEPQCRAPLPAGAEECPRCKGSVAGAVGSAAEHYAAAADFRRELAAARERVPPKKKRKKVDPSSAAARA